ncbi:MAG: phosphate/phosphite/phosphonate ABC transporter substrate-binding protein [Gammaproteobacteria bacterium]|nr:phosphate/phosphite/phosphonate ABC transporter substrate-binding protein [Gammaproteobacteria bacterium]
MLMPIWRFVAVLFAFLALSANTLSGIARAEEPLTLAVHPYLPTKEVMARFTPLADYLSKEIGRPVVVRVGGNYQEHIAHVGKDQADIAFMGPAPYITMVAKYGKKPMLARLEIKGQPLFQGHFIVRNDSPLKSLADLKGKRFAFGDRESTMSHLVPQYMLEKAGVTLDKLADHKFLGSHNNVVLAVLSGDFDAGAVKDEIYDKFAPQGLRSLASTPFFSEHLFVTRNTLSPDIIQTVRTAMLRLKDTPRGREILKAINPNTTALVPAADADYDNLRDVLKALGQLGG